MDAHREDATATLTRMPKLSDGSRYCQIQIDSKEPITTSHATAVPLRERLDHVSGITYKDRSNPSAYAANVPSSTAKKSGFCWIVVAIHSNMLGDLWYVGSYGSINVCEYLRRIHAISRASLVEVLNVIGRSNDVCGG
jgi:hypothetical protein